MQEFAGSSRVSEKNWCSSSAAESMYNVSPSLTQGRMRGNKTHEHKPTQVVQGRHSSTPDLCKDFLPGLHRKFVEENTISWKGSSNKKIFF